LVGASVAGANETVAADATGADAAGADAAGAVCTVEIGTGTVGSTGFGSDDTTGVGAVDPAWIGAVDTTGVGTVDTSGIVVADVTGVGAGVGFEFCNATINGDIGGNATINGDGVVKLIGLALSRAFRTAWNDDDRCKIRSSWLMPWLYMALTRMIGDTALSLSLGESVSVSYCESLLGLIVLSSLIVRRTKDGANGLRRGGESEVGVIAAWFDGVSTESVGSGVVWRILSLTRRITLTADA
jgi:hypothetical protein